MAKKIYQINVNFPLITLVFFTLIMTELPAAIAPAKGTRESYEIKRINFPIS